MRLSARASQNQAQKGNTFPIYLGIFVLKHLYSAVKL